MGEPLRCPQCGSDKYKPTASYKPTDSPKLVVHVCPACACSFIEDGIRWLRESHAELLAALSDLIPTPFPEASREDCDCVTVLHPVGQLRAALAAIAKAKGGAA